MTAYETIARYFFIILLIKHIMLIKLIFSNSTVSFLVMDISPFRICIMELAFDASKAADIAAIADLFLKDRYKSDGSIILKKIMRFHDGSNIKGQITKLAASINI